MREYTTKSGARQFMPSVEEATAMDSDGDGWCLACGSTQIGVEPDARKYECWTCRASKVYGAAELALMGLVH